MTIKAQQRWTLASLFGIAYWFFGNLYEMVVFSPNWISDSPQQMQRLHAFFVNTSPTHYFVPLTQLAILVLWVLWFCNTYQPVKKDLRSAAVFSVLATAINFFIVGTIVLKLFSPDYMQYSDQLNSLCWRWNILNGVRMIITALTAFYLFRVFCILERAR